jgi:hypothetical protein
MPLMTISPTYYSHLDRHRLRLFPDRSKTVTAPESEPSLCSNLKGAEAAAERVFPVVLELGALGTLTLSVTVSLRRESLLPAIE